MCMEMKNHHYDQVEGIFKIIEESVDRITAKVFEEGMAGADVRDCEMPDLINRIRMHYEKEPLQSEQAAYMTSYIFEELSEHIQLEQDYDKEAMLRSLIWRSAIVVCMLKGRSIEEKNGIPEKIDHLVKLSFLITTDEKRKWVIPDKSILEKLLLTFNNMDDGSEERTANRLLDRILENASTNPDFFQADQMMSRNGALRSYSHPVDSKIVEILDRPVVNGIFKNYVDLLVNGTYGQLLASAVPVTARNYQEIDESVDECARILHIKRPYVVVSQAVPGINAITFGTDEKPYIALSCMLVRIMDSEKMRFIIGHECGHIAMGHMVYHTAVNTARIFGHTIPVVGDAVYKMVEYPLKAWSRRSEITADRAGLLCCGSLETACRSLLQIESGFTSAESIDMEEYVRNSRELLKGSVIRRACEYSSTHPLTSKRIEAMQLFARSSLYYELSGRDCDNDPLRLLNQDELRSGTEEILKVI